MVATMKKKFPNIPIFPAIGNHEGSPVNNFPQPYIADRNFSNQWLLDEIDKLVYEITEMKFYIENIFSTTLHS